MATCVGSYCDGGEEAGAPADAAYARVVSYYGQRLANQLGPTCIVGYNSLVTDIDFAGYARHVQQTKVEDAVTPVDSFRRLIRLIAGGGQQLTKAADQIFSNTTPTICTFQNASGVDSAIVLLADNTYRVEWDLSYRSSATTAMLNLQLAFSGTLVGNPTIKLIQYRSLTAAPTVIQSSAFDVNIGTPANGPGASDVPAKLVCVVQVASGGGGLLRLKASAGSGTATIRTMSTVASVQIP